MGVGKVRLYRGVVHQFKIVLVRIKTCRRVIEVVASQSRAFSPAEMISLMIACAPLPFSENDYSGPNQVSEREVGIIWYALIASLEIR